MSKVLCNFCHQNYTSLGIQRISPDGKGEKTAVCVNCEGKKGLFLLLLKGDKEGGSYYPIVLTEKGWKPDEEFQRELDTYIYVNT
jgi:hypothetical protein